MPAKLFFKLDDDKQRKIVNAGISEFSTFGFSNSSTNRIVKQSGISKGSLFKYFSNKEDLFFYLLDNVTTELCNDLEKSAAGFSRDLFQRVMEYSTAEFFWYLQNPEKYGFIMMSFTQTEAEIYSKVMERYGKKEQDIYYRLLKAVDTDHFRGKRETTIDILKWFLKGFNEDFIKKTHVRRHELERIKSDYEENLLMHMEILKNGLYK